MEPSEKQTSMEGDQGGAEEQPRVSCDASAEQRSQRCSSHGNQPRGRRSIIPQSFEQVQPKSAKLTSLQLLVPLSVRLWAVGL